MSYEVFVLKAAETRRDLDVVLHPMFGAIKEAFSILFNSDGFSKADFKRLSDMKYYQGGWPSPTTPPKEEHLAQQIGALIRLEELAGRSNFIDFLKKQGIKVSIDGSWNDDILLNKEDEQDLKDAWGTAGIDKSIPKSKTEALELLLNRAQNLQAEICQTADTIKVDAAQEVETKYQIKKGNFIKAVQLAALRLRKGEGKMAEKIDDVNDQMDNLAQAIEPLTKSK